MVAFLFGLRFIYFKTRLPFLNLATKASLIPLRRRVFLNALASASFENSPVQYL